MGIQSFFSRVTSLFSGATTGDNNRTSLETMIRLTAAARIADADVRDAKIESQKLVVLGDKAVLALTVNPQDGKPVRDFIESSVLLLRAARKASESSNDILLKTDLAEITTEESDRDKRMLAIAVIPATTATQAGVQNGMTEREIFDKVFPGQ